MRYNEAMTITEEYPTIQTRYINGKHYPTVCVKIRRTWEDAISDSRKGEGNLDLDPDDATAFLDWLQAELDGGDFYDRFYIWEEWAQEQAWEDATYEARERFGFPDMKIWSDGRSGGWLYTDTLGSLESWELIDYGPVPSDLAATIQTWNEYAEWAAERAQFVPDDAVGMVYLNVWQIEPGEARTDGSAPHWYPPVSRSGYWA